MSIRIDGAYYESFELAKVTRLIEIKHRCTVVFSEIRREPVWCTGESKCILKFTDMHVSGVGNTKFKALCDVYEYYTKMLANAGEQKT